MLRSRLTGKGRGVLGGRLALAACAVLAICGALAACGAAGGADRPGAVAGAASRAAAASSAAASRAANGNSATATPSRTAPAAHGSDAPAATTAELRGPDGPAGFWYGSDSWPIPVSGRGPYRTPGVGGAYAGYIGMAGNWARWQGCGTGNFLAWSGTNSQEANANYTKYQAGIGTGVYWYMGGPGVDPRWNGTTGEAAAWGTRQAAAALASVAHERVTYPILFLDIEMPGIAPAPDNGWNAVYTSSCSGAMRGGHVSPAVARAEFNGFVNYLTSHSRYLAGVYSDPVTWTQIFGTGSAAQIPHTYEWTYAPETANLGHAPRGWCLKGSSQCAQFFGGVGRSSRYAVMWQWSGGGGVRNPIGDFDQIDTTSIR
jgi:hypothetical protein